MSRSITIKGYKDVEDVQDVTDAQVKDVVDVKSVKGGKSVTDVPGSPLPLSASRPSPAWPGRRRRILSSAD
jgi:hypothetical protein